LQGTIGDADPVYDNKGYLNDIDIANDAASWLAQRQTSDTPWCLTVAFINPHDKEFFPADTEFKTFTDLYCDDRKYNPNGYVQFMDFKAGPPKYNWVTNPLKTPDSLAYPPVPPNWESADHICKEKPSTQTFARLFQEAVWGGVNDETSATDFSIVLYPTNSTSPPATPPTSNIGVAKAPYSYWPRSLDSYSQIMQIVDRRIGTVIEALPSAVKDNSIIILTSDHGEYAGAHGFVSGKAG
jgi:arylsulfatase A-like enzyme